MPRSSHKHKRSSSKGAGELRIIGGQLRGRKLAIAEVPGLRPTTDRIRETLFNWLQFEITDQRCLDLFAGSGALGFEALSRGASQVIMIEKDSQASQLLSQHAATLNEQCPGQALVQRNDAILFLAQRPDSPWDIVFIDPPFNMGLADDCIALLNQHQWLHEDSWIYLETEHNWQPSVPPHWQLHREKIAGQVAYRLYYVASELTN